MELILLCIAGTMIGFSTHESIWRGFLLSVGLNSVFIVAYRAYEALIV